MARSAEFLLAGAPAATVAAAENEAQPARRPAGVDLDAEWQFQFEDVSRQITGLDKHVAQVQRSRRAGYMTPLDHAGDLVGETFRRDALILPADRDPVDVVARRTAAVLSAVRQLGPKTELAPLESRLKQLISDIVFITRAGAHEHCCDQYFGFANDGGGGLFVLEHAFDTEPVLRDVLVEATVERGPLKGQKLRGGFARCHGRPVPTDPLHSLRRAVLRRVRKNSGASTGNDGLAIGTMTPRVKEETLPCVTPAFSRHYCCALAVPPTRLRSH
jgi:hypothetical protein